MNASDITEIWKLIDAGANINVINKYGANLLFLASQEGHAEVVRLLLEARAYVNIKIELRGEREHSTKFGRSRRPCSQFWAFKWVRAP
jgi:ankyrin repeat protein